MAACLLALGSNQGERFANLLAALAELRNHSAISVQRVSSFLETRPVGGPAGQSNYFNAAAVVETQLAPAELIFELLKIEKKLGRERSERWGPRTIDLDVLLYGDQVISRPEITVPHPRMEERPFVLTPAAEIADDWVHPTSQKTIFQLLTSLPNATSGLGLRVITSPADIQAIVLALRRARGRVALVPTMGALHAGHLSLVHIARQHAETVIATIFVNPTQFGPHEDFAKYPRTLDGDLQALSDAGCNFVFVPTADEIYPPGFSTYIEPPAVAQPLEGVCRPGHFRGVATVVLKLFHLVPAHVACFGQKDFQQLLVIRRMVEDLSLPMEIVSCPIVREPDGLAMSSRNRYLSPADREMALAISRALDRAAQLAAAGEENAAAIVSQMHAILNQAGIEHIDYATLADPETLTELTSLDGPAIALIAAHVGKTRLIDNRLLNT